MHAWQQARAASSSSSSRRPRRKTIAGYLGEDFDVEASRRSHPRPARTRRELPADMKKGPFGKFAVDVDNGFEAVLRRRPRQEEEGRRAQAAAQGRRRALPRHRRGPRGRGHRLAPARGAQAQGPGQADGLPRDHQGGDPARRQRHPRARHRGSSTPRRPAASSTGSTATRSRPVLWRKVRQGLSAGRVQSVATRLVVERERERMAFRARVLLGRRGRLRAASDAERAGLHRAADRRSTAPRSPPAATSPTTARCAPPRRRPPRRGGRDRARRRASRAADVAVTASRRSPTPAARPRRSRPRPCSRRPAASCGCPRKNAMRVAQRLYENGYITYMRTDCTTLSEAALTAARSQARELYGAEYVPDAPRRYESKVKNAQEAHEAIRPAGDRFRTPAQVAGELRGDEFALYELIWKRTVASQMADARGSTATVRLGADAAPTAATSSSRASGTVITFRGFLAAYEEGRDDDAAARAQARRRGAPPAEARRRRRRSTVAAGRGRRPRDQPAAALHRGHAGQGAGGAAASAARRPTPSTIGTIQDRGYVYNRGLGAGPDLAGVRGDPAARGALRRGSSTTTSPPRWRRTSTGSPTATSSRVAWLQRFYFGDEAELGRGPARPRRRPRRDRRPRDLHHPDRRRHRRAGRPLRAVRRGDRAGRRRPRDRRGDRRRER